MEIKSLNKHIRVWRPAGFAGIELRQGVNVGQPYPKHWHEEYHFCLVQSGSGTIHYRREHRPQHPGSITIVHPGEVHSNQADDGVSCSFRNLYIEPQIIKQVAADITCRLALPFFSPSPIKDRELIRQFLKLHESMETDAARLERDEVLLGFLTSLIYRYSESRIEFSEVSREREAVNRAREYLTENFAENVSLEQLAELACLSPFHLNRVFSKEFGLPPHAFQTQVRIARAKSLLLKGEPISQAAFEVGFVDQSHFTRHFRRLVGITPGHYLQESKNVQDRQRSCL